MAREEDIEQPVAQQKQTIVIRDIDIPFWRVVVIMIKWALAAGLAAFIVSVIYYCILILITGDVNHPGLFN
ncbi:MAG: hypothetical protein AAF405_02020 [Pseudomonadota bacterium]